MNAPNLLLLAGASKPNQMSNNNNNEVQWDCKIPAWDGLCCKIKQGCDDEVCSKLMVHRVVVHIYPLYS